MSDPLMIHVERVVRPVRAEAGTRMRMREELHRLLMDIHADEAERAADNEAAIAGAISRFGEAKPLTDELQQGIPRHEQFLCGIERAVRRRDGESAVRHAFRMTLFMLVTMLASASIGVSLAGLPAGEQATRIALSFSGVLMGCIILDTFALVLLGQALQRCFAAERVLARLGAIAIPLVAAVLAASSIVVPVAVVARSVQPAREMLRLTLPAAVVVALFMPAVAWLMLRELRQAEPWESLTLD